MHKSVTLPSPVNPRTKKRIFIRCVIAFIVLCAIVLDSKVVRTDSVEGRREQGSQPDEYGVRVFSAIQNDVASRAIPAAELAELLNQDARQATEKYGVGSVMPVFPVTFTGVASQGKMGIYTITVTGVPASLHIRLQTGPAISGTDLRDATGNIHFGDFKNQIEYQNAAVAINQEMKQRILATVDTDSLSGKTLTVTGVFRLLNQDNWLVTPVRMELQ